MAAPRRLRMGDWLNKYFEIGRQDDGKFSIQLRESVRYRQAAVEAFGRTVLWIMTFPNSRDKKFLTIFAVCALTWFVQKWAGSAHQRALNRQKAREKRMESAKAKMELLKRVTTTDKDILVKREEILNLTLADLSKSLKAGVYSPTEVLHAYQAKAMECTSQVNCVTEPIEEAEEWAKELETDDEKKGLLFGIPVSVKENVQMKGYDATLGFGKFVHQPAVDDSVLVKVLKQQGAVPFVRTNVPQMLLSFVCSNPVYGETVNPVNPDKVPGGSSGGEAALIRMGGSVLGIGTDILGSARIPAHFSGVCGFKPTQRRLSSAGICTSIPGQKSVSGCPGVMAQDIDSIALGMKALLVPEMFELDKTVLPVPFNEEVYADGRRLRIGYYDYDKIITPTPPCRRAVAMAKEALEQAGHTLIAFDPPGMDNPYQHPMPNLTFLGAFADNYDTIRNAFKDEDMDPYVGVQLKSYLLPSIVKRVASFIFGFWSPRIQALLRCTSGVGSVHDLWQLHAKREAYINDFLTRWTETGIDVLICPVFAIPACRPEEAGEVTFAASYCSIFNLLDFPAGSVPVTTVTEEDEEEMEKFPQRDLIDKLTKKAFKDCVGLPIGVQCVAPPWQEELCLRLMKEVQNAVE